MIRDIHPRTPIAALPRDLSPSELAETFDVGLVAAIAGMSPSFVFKVLGSQSRMVTLEQVLQLLDQDAFGETFVPRSRIPHFLLERREQPVRAKALPLEEKHNLLCGNTVDLIRRLPERIVDCVVTSTPYWGTRLYDEKYVTRWADGETCAFGNEQTPEGFLRHSVEVLYYLHRVVKKDGSVWWNVMDSYNTRTQIRRSASETLRAMKGKDERGWKDHECRRYSAGHAFLEDGEQCGIPGRLAERLSRIGYLVKSLIIWKKNGSMPETVKTRVTREIEVILHLSLQRSPYFDKTAFLSLPAKLGGRNKHFESGKITDVWHFSTASGKDGHGAQFPLALPARCIGLSSRVDDLVLDPFLGSGTTAVAAALLGRRSIGFDISARYLETARRRLRQALALPLINPLGPGEEPPLQATLL